MGQRGGLNAKISSSCNTILGTSVQCAGVRPAAGLGFAKMHSGDNLEDHMVRGSPGTQGETETARCGGPQGCNGVGLHP